MDNFLEFLIARNKKKRGCLDLFRRPGHFRIYSPKDIPQVRYTLSFREREVFPGRRWRSEPGPGFPGGSGITGESSMRGDIEPRGLRTGSLEDLFLRTASMTRESRREMRMLKAKYFRRKGGRGEGADKRDYFFNIIHCSVFSFRLERAGV